MLRSVLVVVLVAMASCEGPAPGRARANPGGTPAMVEDTPPAPAAPLRPFECVVGASELARANALVRDQRLQGAELEAAMNDAMRAAQSPSTSSTATPSVEALARSSADLSQGLDPLMSVLAGYRQRGLGASGAAVSACARAFASNELARLAIVVEQQRLYRPALATGAGRLFDRELASSPPAYLDQQLDSARALLGIAGPFVALLSSTDVDAEPVAPVAYWRNTIDELNRFTQVRDPAGQLAALHALLVVVAGLDLADCARGPAALAPEELGNDRFSQRRRELMGDVRSRCPSSSVAPSAGGAGRPTPSNSGASRGGRPRPSPPGRERR